MWGLVTSAAMCKRTRGCPRPGLRRQKMPPQRPVPDAGSDKSNQKNTYVKERTRHAPGGQQSDVSRNVTFCRDLAHLSNQASCLKFRFRFRTIARLFCICFRAQGPDVVPRYQTLSGAIRRNQALPRDTKKTKKIFDAFFISGFSSILFPIVCHGGLDKGCPTLTKAKKLIHNPSPQISADAWQNPVNAHGRRPQKTKTEFSRQGAESAKRKFIFSRR